MYKYVATFTVGAVIGAVGTLLWLRKEYNKKVEEAVIEHDKNKNVQTEEKEKTEEAPTEKRVNKKMPSAVETINAELIRKHKYVSDDVEATVRTDDTQKETPYGISGDEFLMDKKEYDKISLMYYDDGVLATEDGTVVDDILYVLGPNWKQEIGKYDDDVAYIRNDRIGADYEVIREHLDYSAEYGHDLD